VALAGAASNRVAGLLILVLGNLLILLVEGLVVSIQTTRLVLFEFFTRFFRPEGREFRPLAAPPVTPH
jgi:V/A-type H+-transporting ATPase subunit I